MIPYGPEMAALASKLWGEPNRTLSTRVELRFGTNGSKSLKLADGIWFDHESNAGGGYRDMFKAVHGTYPKNGLDHTAAFRPPAGMVKELGPPIAFWDYHDAAGAGVARVVRFEPPGAGKTFRQCRPDGDGWRWKMDGLQIPLYHLPEILTAAPGTTVFVTEGEKHADQIRAWGLTATTNAGGAKKFRRDHAQALTGFDCVLLPDNDGAGREHAAAVVRELRSAGCTSIRTLNLPDLPEKGDILDWVKAGGTAKAFAKLAVGAKPVPMARINGPAPWTPPPDEDAPPDDDPRPDVPPPDADPAAEDVDLVTEGNVASAFAAAHGNQLRYCHTTGSWFEWIGTHWKQEQTKLAYRWAHQKAKALAKESGEVRTMMSAGKAAFAAGVERIAQSDRAFAVTSETWDADRWLLGTPGGTVDLHSGQLRAATQADYITKTTGCTPAATPECPIWLRFLEEATNGDEGLIRFLRQWAGYTLTGDTREDALVFVHGSGGNGKGVFLNTLIGIMGAYCEISAMDTFVAANGDRHPADLAMLKGARMVCVSETEEGRAWAESRIKAMTGRDKITARFMRQNFFTLAGVQAADHWQPQAGASQRGRCSQAQVQHGAVSA